MEGNLIHRLQRKESRAYMELYDYYFPRLHGFARSFVFDGEVAKDIVQNVLIRLYENISQWKPDANIGAWLCVAVRNGCLNYLRDRDVEDRHKTLYLQAVEKAEMWEWVDDEELIADIRKAVSELPDKYREVCELRFYYNLGYPEIAERLAVSENVAKVRVHRAVQKIKEVLVGKKGRIIGWLIFVFPFFSFNLFSSSNRK